MTIDWTDFWKWRNALPARPVTLDDWAKKVMPPLRSHLAQKLAQGMIIGWEGSVCGCPACTIPRRCVGGNS